MAGRKKVTRRPTKRMSVASRVRKSVDLFKRFREENPDRVLEKTITLPKSGIVVGTLDTVEYTTSRGGKIEYYRHEFREKSKPLLVASADGKQLLIVGGHFEFTERGIVDN